MKGEPLALVKSVLISQKEKFTNLSQMSPMRAFHRIAPSIVGWRRSLHPRKVLDERGGMHVEKYQPVQVHVRKTDRDCFFPLIERFKAEEFVSRFTESENTAKKTLE